MANLIRLHAIALSDDDGGRAATLTAPDLAATIHQTNRYFLEAGIQFVFDPATDWEPMNDTWLNTMDRSDSDWPARANAVAEARPGAMVVYFRWGTEPIPTGNGNAGPPDIGWPIPHGWRNEPTDVGFVTMPSTQPLVDQGPAFLAHEVGHFLGLYHTFPGTSDGHIIALKDGESLTPAEADQRLIDFVRKHGGSESALDGDLVDDTTPDPGTAFWTTRGQAECGGPGSIRLTGTLRGKAYDLTLTPPRDNIMSYYRCADKKFTPGQIEKLQATIAHPSRSHLVRPQGPPNLLFYNQGNGSWATGQLRGDGSFDSLVASKPSSFSTWTHIVGSGSGALMFYNQGNRQWSTGFMTADGNYSTVHASEPNAFSAWTHVVSAGNGALLFYNQANRQWSTGVLQADGSFHTVYASPPNSFSTWTHLVGAGNDALLFYNQASGQWSTGILQADGSFHTVYASPPNSFSTWTHLVSSGNGTLLFYNQANRQWSTGILQADGSFHTVYASPPNSFSTWTHLVSSGNGTLLFYNQANRQWSTGILQADGSFHTVYASPPNSFSTWTHLVGAGNDALLFYNQANRQWSTGILQADGSFHTVYASPPNSFSTWTHITNEGSVR